MNFSNIKLFTDLLFDLYVEQKLLLKNSLQIMGETENSNKRVKNAARELLGFLEDGNDFSSALGKCSYIKFDSSYKCFIYLAQMNGSLESTIVFLKEKYERIKERNSNIQISLFYPLFIILISVFGSLFLIFNLNYFFTDIPDIEKTMKIGFVKSLIFLLITSGGALYGIIKNSRINPVYESIKAAAFLIKSGASMGSAVGFAVLISGPETEVGRYFARAKERIELGMDLGTAFEVDKNKIRKLIGIKEIEHTVRFVQRAGEKNNFFEKLAFAIEKSELKKQKVIMNLLEPLFSGITGGFIFLLVINCLMPVITYSGFAL